MQVATYKNAILQSTVALAVDIELLRIKTMPESCWPKPDDIVNCPRCKGTGKNKDNGACYDCLGQRTMERREAIAQTIASHGDDLEYGGTNCRKAFKAVVDAYVLLNLYSVEGRSIPILGARPKIIPHNTPVDIPKDRLKVKISPKDLAEAIKKL